MSLSNAERRERLHVRDAYHPALPRIEKLLAAGKLHREIGEAVGLDRSRVSQIMRAVKAATAARFTDLGKGSAMKNQDLVDVIEVECAPPHGRRLMQAALSKQDAESFIRMAVMRRGVATHFYTTQPTAGAESSDTSDEEMARRMALDLEVNGL